MSIIVVPRKSLDIVITCDPAISERDSAARSAITVVALSPYNKYFLLEMWAGRSGDPQVVIDHILEMANYWQPRLIGVEAVAFQQSMEPYMKRRMEQLGIWYPIEMLRPDRNEKKEQRIKSLVPFFRTGQIYIQRGMFDFIGEYETFPTGRTKDILDAFSYAIRMLTPQQPDRIAGVEMQIAALVQRDPMSARYWKSEAVKRGDIEPDKTIDDYLDEDDEEHDYVTSISELMS